MNEIFPVKMIFIPKNYFYMLYISDEYGNDSVATYRGKITLFQTFIALKHYVNQHFSDSTFFPEITAFNVLSCKRQIRNQKHTGEVTGLINLLLDIFNTLKIDDLYIIDRKNIYEFANFTTFEADLKPFFVQNPSITTQRVNAFIDWGTGVLLNSSIIL